MKSGEPKEERNHFGYVVPQKNECSGFLSCDLPYRAKCSFSISSKAISNSLLERGIEDIDAPS